MQIEIPDLSVVALVGASGSGKSTLAARYFKPTEILSSDFFRAMVSDDENDQSATKDAFDLLYYAANKRLSAGKLVVIDATNVKKDSRKPVIELAHGQDVQTVAIVLDFTEAICQERNKGHQARNLPPHIIRGHVQALKQSLKYLRKEGFRYVYVFNSPQELENLEVVRVPLWTDKREKNGPFDIIGDVHGCFDELCQILRKLDYSVDEENFKVSRQSAAPRQVIFLGDLCDRGPKNVQVLRLVINMVKDGLALCIPGNHDVKLLKYLNGSQVRVTHGLAATIEALDGEALEFREEVKNFIDSLVSHYVLDGGKLVVTHAGLPEKYQGRASGRVRSFCLYGETTGELDEFGFPQRIDWTEGYRGKANVVYGHIALEKVREVNGTFGIDTGCVFGGHLTAMRWPEKEFVSVPALSQYYAPIRPLGPATEDRGYCLDTKDVIGKRYIATELRGGVQVLEGNASAALEIMSRFAADPRWLIYLPPTMSPCEVSPLDDYLEHPTEAFSFFRSHNVNTVIIEEKHMGSRAVIVLCRNEKTAHSRFGLDDGSRGIVYSRTGRHFFDGESEDTESELLHRLGRTLEETGFWQDISTDWICLDTELMPWSAKAGKLITEQYAATAEAGRLGLSAAITALQMAKERISETPENIEEKKENLEANLELSKLLEKFKKRSQALERYTEIYRHYCWPSPNLDDLRLAPFHILATEGRVWKDIAHIKHLNIIKKYIAWRDPIFMNTKHLIVDVTDEESVQAGVNWWYKLTESGGEGMVVKPVDFVVKQGKKLIQPAVKCRGREYLRIIYGPDYLQPQHLRRIKHRSLGKKGHLALDEFALGLEALERFVRGEPLYRVHECVFGVLALESEPVDPRL
ncbi:MAG: polynucleotide kinase-phosphatase [Deltaproteobacteria bacterium]|jgi:protein phosphatase|nr:polynucleotide kinase-phosphatase [Deltaproteobacteria bacterium]